MTSSGDLSEFSKVLNSIYRWALDPMALPDFAPVLEVADGRLLEQGVLDELAHHFRLAAELAPPEPVTDHPVTDVLFSRDLKVLAADPAARGDEGCAQSGNSASCGSTLYRGDEESQHRLEEAVARLNQQKSAAGARTIVVLPTNAGFSVGFVTREENAFRLVLVHNGEERSLDDASGAFAALTASERRICDLLYQGYTVKQICDKVGRSENTVKTQMKSVFSKVGLSSQKDLVHLFEIVRHHEKQFGEGTAGGEPLPITARNAPLRRTLTLPSGRTIAWRDYGSPSGPPVFYIHGLYAGSLFGPMHMQAINQHGVRMIALDRAGYGQSSPHSKPGRIEDSLADYLAVADHLGLECFSVFGFGFGATYSLALAQAAPERVTRLYLCSPGLGLWIKRPGRHSPAELLMRIAQRTPGGIEAILRLLNRRRGRAEFGDWARRFWGACEADRQVLEDEALIDHFWEVSDENLHQGAKGAVNDLLSSKGAGLELETIGVPTVIWQGAIDKVENAGQIRSYLERLPHHEFNLVPQKGQLLFHSDFAALMARMANQDAPIRSDGSAAP